MPGLLRPLKKKYPGFLSVFDKEALDLFMNITSQVVEQRKHEKITVRKSSHLEKRFIRLRVH